MALLAGLWLNNVVEAHEVDATPPASQIRSTPSAIFKDASAAVDAFHAALSSGDAKAALGLLADDVQIFEQGEVERSKTEYGSHHLPSDIEFSRTTESRQTSRSGAALGDFAYVVSEGTITGRYKDKDIAMISIETMVLHHDPLGWRIVHIHWSSRKAKA